MCFLTGELSLSLVLGSLLSGGTEGHPVADVAVLPVLSTGIPGDLSEVVGPHHVPGSLVMAVGSHEELHLEKQSRKQMWCCILL